MSNESKFDTKMHSKSTLRIGKTAMKSNFRAGEEKEEHRSETR